MVGEVSSGRDASTASNAVANTAMRTATATTTGSTGSPHTVLETLVEESGRDPSDLAMVRVEAIDWRQKLELALASADRSPCGVSRP